MKCDICDKTVFYFQPQMSSQDYLVKVIWHKACASSYEEWEKKIIEKISKPMKIEFDPQKLKARFGS